jgi:LL-diaminopimelate aminotransferase
MSEVNNNGSERPNSPFRGWGVSKRLDGIGEYYFSQKLREIDELNKQGKNIINLGIGSPDLPPHPDVIKTLQDESAKSNVHAYQSYKGSPVLRNAIAAWYKKWYGVELDPDTEILPLIGSKEGIMHICMTYFENGVGVLVPNPGYPTYSSAIKLSGATPIYYELKEENNYYPDFTQLEKLIKENSQAPLQGMGVKAIFVNYPQMPTGQLPSKGFFEKLVAFAKANNILVIHDNPYSFILNDEPMSLLSVDGAKDVVIELNSLSKSQNMAGWRVGMLVSNKQKIDEVLRFKSNMDSGMFLPVQLAAAKALSLGKDWYDSVNVIYRKRREKVFELLDLLKCEYSKQQVGMFVWAKVTSPTPPKEGLKNPLGLGGELSDKVLYNANVFITPGGIFGSAGENYVRVSLCTPEEKFIESIKQVKEFLASKTTANV